MYCSLYYVLLTTFQEDARNGLRSDLLHCVSENSFFLPRTAGKYYTSMWTYNLKKKKRPNNYCFPHNTPLTNLNIMHEHSVGYLWMLRTPFPLILQFHMPTKKKSSFATKEDDGIDCSSKYSRKNKIQFCFIICVRKFVKPSCPVATLLQQSCCVSWRWHRHISLLCKPVPTFSLRYLQSSSKSVQIFLA